MRISESVKCSKGSGVGLGLQTPESTEKSSNPEGVACDGNPGAREAETGRCLGLQTRFRKIKKEKWNRAHKLCVKLTHKNKLTETQPTKMSAHSGFQGSDCQPLCFYCYCRCYLWCVCVMWVCTWHHTCGSWKTACVSWWSPSTIAFQSWALAINLGHRGLYWLGPQINLLVTCTLKNSKRFRNVQNVILRSLGSQRTREP